MMVMRRYYTHTICFIAFLLLIFSIGCCNPGTNPALVPPTVAPGTPPGGAAGVWPNTGATAAFSVAMNASTINTNTFTLTTGTPPVAVAGDVTYATSTDTATFNS